MHPRIFWSAKWPGVEFITESLVARELMDTWSVADPTDIYIYICYGKEEQIIGYLAEVLLLRWKTWRNVTGYGPTRCAIECGNMVVDSFHFP